MVRESSRTLLRHISTMACTAPPMAAGCCENGLRMLPTSMWWVTSTIGASALLIACVRWAMAIGSCNCPTMGCTMASYTSSSCTGAEARASASRPTPRAWCKTPRPISLPLKCGRPSKPISGAHAVSSHAATRCSSMSATSAWRRSKSRLAPMMNSAPKCCHASSTWDITLSRLWPFRSTLTMGHSVIMCRVSMLPAAASAHPRHSST